MAFPKPRLTITAKLGISLIIFVLIFYGTIVYVFMHIQQMMRISEEIVNINNVIATQSKNLIENLLAMDGNAQKYNLLSNEVYRASFDAAKENFDTSLQTINLISARGYRLPQSYNQFFDEYTTSYQTLIQEGADISWVAEETVTRWLELLVDLRDNNQKQIEESMKMIHQLTYKSTRDGLIGFGITVIVASVGIFFMANSFIIPVKQLTQGLRNLTRGDFDGEIKINSTDEFADLAVAFNDMNRELKEEENLREDFIATLSHEIKTPLSSIKESVNMIDEELLGPLNEKQHKFLSIAGDEVTRINEMLNQLLHVSKIEASTSEITLAPVAIEEILLDCTAILQSMASLKNITFAYDLPSPCPLVMGSVDHIKQILINLINNGIKFSPSNSQIEILIKDSMRPGFIQILIKDEGPGIAEKEQTLIFHKYYRSKSIRKHMDGVGLGLYISNRIAVQMNGSIKAENRTSKGAVFTLTLPKAAE